MKSLTKRSFALAGTALTLAAGWIGIRNARGSDHADTPQIAASPGTDITDVFVFPSATNSNNVVLAMCVSPLIPTGGTRAFDPTVLYQFKIDNTGDKVEDLVIQARFEGTGTSQKVIIAGPSAPSRTGTMSDALIPLTVTGTFNSTFSPNSGMQVFAGVREDPFFFDLEQFFTIFPDRATPILVRTPLVMAMWESRATALGCWPTAGPGCTWQAVRTLAESADGWASLSLRAARQPSPGVR